MWDQKHGNFLKIFPFPNAQPPIKHLAKKECYLLKLSEQ